jgi:hypothetical protein
MEIGGAFFDGGFEEAVNLDGGHAVPVLLEVELTHAKCRARDSGAIAAGGIILL